MRPNLMFLIMLTAAVPALAQDRPLILPIRDVAVEYHTTGMVPGPAGDLTTTVMARFASNRRLLRVDGAYGQFYAIVDVEAGTMAIVMPEQHLYVEQPADPTIIALLQGPGLRRIGTDTVAGLPCTAYDAEVNDRAGQVCLTDDGVLLRAKIADRDRQPELDAISVTYARQPERMFEIPLGFHQLSIPDLPYGPSLGLPGAASQFGR